MLAFMRMRTHLCVSVRVYQFARTHARARLAVRMPVHVPAFVCLSPCAYAWLHERIRTCQDLRFSVHRQCDICGRELF